MTITFIILALVTLAGAIAAMTLRHLVHCALALTVAFAGLATLFLQLDAQFVGLAQILVYIGAVAILIVFAILLTRGSEPLQQPVVTSSWVMGDRKSTRLNSSHRTISYAVFCLKKKNKTTNH